MIKQEIRRCGGISEEKMESPGIQTVRYHVGIAFSLSYIPLVKKKDTEEIIRRKDKLVVMSKGQLDYRKLTL